MQWNEGKGRWKEEDVMIYLDIYQTLVRWMILIPCLTMYTIVHTLLCTPVADLLEHCTNKVSGSVLPES